MTYYTDFAFYENISEWVMDYNGLADPFAVKQQIGITNTYSALLWFRAELVAPGGNYANFSVDLGTVDAGLSDYKAFTFDRVRPGAKVTDNLTLRLTAYTDAYITPLCNDDLAVSFYLFDHTALNLVDHDTFDTEGDFEGWTAYGTGTAGRYGISQATDYYINAPYSIQGSGTTIAPSGYVYGMTKTFAIGAVSEAFLVYHYHKINDTGVKLAEINGVSIIPTPILLEYGTGKWFRFALKIPVNQNVEVKLGMYASSGNTNQRFDEIWVVTSP